MEWQWIGFENALAITGPNLYQLSGNWMELEWIPEFMRYATKKVIKVTGFDSWTNLDMPGGKEIIMEITLRPLEPLELDLTPNGGFGIIIPG